MHELTQIRAVIADPEDATSFAAQAGPLLSALASHDRATRSHSESVASWSRRIANDLELPRSIVKFIERCALLHDVGKLLTPQEILTKAGPLTAGEWIRMKAHAGEGAAMLSANAVLAQYASVVAAHHEHYDGRGYPAGLSGDEIPFEARIIAVADAFDAMIGDRCYRAPIAPSAALAELRRCRGSQFEPAVVNSLVAVVSMPRRAGIRAQTA